MTTIARHIQVTGKVQGVCYRAALRDWCTQNDIKGWIKNEPDGSVQMHIEGDEEAITQCIRVAREGSTDAQVNELLVTVVSTEHHVSFTIIT